MSAPAASTGTHRHADDATVARLRAGDEAAFATLVRRYQAPMARVARAYVPSQAVAEEVVQETWLAVLDGLERFEGRSSLKTWIFRILVNRAKTRGTRERRSVAFSALAAEDAGPSVPPDRFLPPDHPDGAGHWAVPPARVGRLPEDHVVATELLDRVRACIDGLAPRQRAVITLRDVQGWSPAEVCATLGLSEGNQRVLLHRARSTVRAEYERYLLDTDDASPAGGDERDAGGPPPSAGDDRTAGGPPPPGGDDRAPA